MFFQKYKDKALADLDNAHQDYDQLAKDTIDLFDDLNAAKDGAFELITEVEAFIASIRRGPFALTKELSKIKKQKDKFLKSEDIKRKERREKITGGAGAVAALGVGAAVAASFWDFIDAKLGSKLTKIFGKNVLVSLVIGVLVLVFLLIFIIAWAVSNHRAGKKAEKLTIQIINETELLRRESVAAVALTKTLRKQYEIVGVWMDELAAMEGKSRKEMTDEQYNDVKALLYDTVALSELLNKQPSDKEKGEKNEQ